jgi:hypothetical protein
VSSTFLFCHWETTRFLYCCVTLVGAVTPTFHIIRLCLCLPLVNDQFADFHETDMKTMRDIYAYAERNLKVLALRFINMITLTERCVLFSGENGQAASCRERSGIILENDSYNCYSIFSTTMSVELVTNLLLNGN